MSAQQALPDAVVQGLRRTFADEVRARLPHLRVPADVERARLDAHTLASSAWVVGEHELSRLARSVEEELAWGDVAGLTSLVVALEGFQA